MAARHRHHHRSCAWTSADRRRSDFKFNARGHSTREGCSFPQRSGRNPHRVPLLQQAHEGQYQHFKAIAEAVGKPIVLYNVPGRTAANIEPATLARLAKIHNIVAVKEASGSMTQIAEVLNVVPDDFTVLSGDDAVTLPVISLGGRGIISVASNVIPAEIAQMTQAALDDDFPRARALHRKYLPLMQALFIESNPMPAKCLLAMMGRIEENYRLPMVPVKPETRAKLEKIAVELGLLAERVAAR